MTTYKRLGELLVSGGAVTKLELSIALAAQQTSNRRLGEILVERGFATEDKIAQCLADQYGCPVEDVKSLTPTRAALETMALWQALEQRILPVEITDTEIYCVVADPLDVSITDELGARLRRRVKIAVAPASAIEASIRRCYGVEEIESTDVIAIPELPSRYTDVEFAHQYGELIAFSAMDDDLRRPVCIIGAPQEDADDFHFPAIRNASKAISACVCRVYDTFTMSGWRWSVVEPFQGESLARTLQTRGKRTASQAAELVSAIAESVDVLHESGGYLGWLCPENVVMSKRGPILVPFSAPRGTYGQGTRSIAADLSALGTLLWQCLAPDGEKNASWNKQMENLPDAMQRIISRCTGVGTTERFSSAIEVASALRSYNWSVQATAPGKKMATEREELLLTLNVVDGQSQAAKPGFWQRIFGKAA